MTAKEWPEETAASNCYSILLVHQIQPSLTFICYLNPNHIFLVASWETIRVVEEYWGTTMQRFSIRELQCSKIAGPNVLMLAGGGGGGGPKLNQSVENTGVAFVKGANGWKLFLWKNKQTVIYDEQVVTNNLSDELVCGWIQSKWPVDVSLRQ